MIGNIIFYMIVNHTSLLHPPPVVLWFILTTVQMKLCMTGDQVRVSGNNVFVIWVTGAGYSWVFTEPMHKPAEADIDIQKGFYKPLC